MADLRVKHAAKPKPGEEDVYDITMGYGPSGVGLMLKPFIEDARIGLGTGSVIISDQSYADATLITQWAKWPAVLRFDDEEDPRGGWTVYGEEEGYTPIPAITSAYGVLPASYTKTYYTLNRIAMWLLVGWKSVMLYNSNYEPVDYGMVPRSSTGNMYIKYEAELTRKSDAAVITLEGTSTAFSFASNNTLIRPDNNMEYVDTRGDCKGDVAMIETPVTM